MLMRDARGFTLIEILVVVAIIAMVTALSMPSITSYFHVSMESATREMSSIIKETYNSAVITGRVHRIVYDFKDGSYWVESGPPNVLLDTAESREKEERRKRFAKASEAPPPPKFSMETSVTRKKVSLPRGIKFEDILTTQSPDPITEGKAYTHFFPHGLIEQTVVHLMDESKHHDSLVIQPLIGRTDLYEHYVNGAEAFGK